MELLNLPEHILVKICDYSAVKELGVLMSTCQRLNQLVSNSKKLTDKFNFTWSNEQSRNVVKNSIRHYKRATVDMSGEVYRRSSVALFNKFSSSLESFEMNYNFIVDADLQLMLNHLAPSNMVKVAKFNKIFLEPQVLFNSEEVVKIPSLKELYMENSDCKFLQYFQGMQVTIFSFTTSLRCITHVDAVTQFLASQKCLKSLVLNAGSIANVFKEDVADKCNFQLEKLEVSTINLKEVEAINLNKFLKKQEKTLQSLKVVIEEVSSLQIIATMLKGINVPDLRLELDDFIFGDDFIIGNFGNVTNLLLKPTEVPTAENILALGLFKNLVELTLIETEFNRPMYNILKDLPKLRKIRFNTVHFKTFGVLPQVTEMEIFEPEKMQHAKIYLRINKQLVEVKNAGREYVRTEYMMAMLKNFLVIQRLDPFGQIQRKDLAVIAEE